MLIAAIVSAVGSFTGTAVPSTPFPLADEPAARHARVALVAEREQLVAGSTAYLGLHFKLEPHWHTYWLGTPTASSQLEVNLDLPAGFQLGAIQWPAPKRHISEGDILDHIYENEVTLILPIAIPASAKPGETKLTGTIKYLVCDTSCVFEEATLSLSLPVVAAGTPATESKSAPLFKAARAKLPKPLPTGTDAPKVARSAAAFTIDAPGARGLSFFPAADCILLADPISAAHVEKSKLSLSVEPGGDTSAPFRGVLEVRYPDSRGTAWFAIEPDSIKVTPN